MFVCRPPPEPKLFEGPTWVESKGLEVDAAAVGVARGRGAIDLALGATVLELLEGDRLLQLGYSKLGDYARERLGLAPRTVHLLTRLARELEDRPVLRRAVAAGRLTTRKALAIARVAVGDREPEWVHEACRLTLSDLEEAVRRAGEEPPRDAFEVEVLWLKMTPAQQERFDLGLAVAQRTVGFGTPRWQCVEAMCQEWLGSWGEHEPEEVDGEALEATARSDPKELRTWRTEAVERQLRLIEEAVEVSGMLGVVGESGPGPDPGSGSDLVSGPDPVSGPAEAVSLDARARRLAQARQGHDVALGPVLRRVVEGDVWEILGYLTPEEYCRERLGLSGRTVRQRVWLERRLESLPELREALAEGRLTYSKALLVAKDAGPGDVAERIEEARSTTWQQLEEESTEKEERQNRAAGVRRLWGPRDVAETVVAAIACARAWSESERGESLDAGEALAVIADHFVSVWTAKPEKKEDEPKALRELREKFQPPPDSGEVLSRRGGLCAVPGCSRPAEHSHHIVFRRHGGTDEAINKVRVCVPHHLHGIHRGYLSVSGRAGEHLVWRFGPEDVVAVEVWETLGHDDVRRVSPPDSPCDDDVRRVNV